MYVAAQYSVIIHLELYVAVNMQLYPCNHVCCTFTLYKLYWLFSICRLSKYKHNLYYVVSDKVCNNKREITTRCRSNLIGCLQSTVPLRPLIKAYYLCTGSDIMCKQWVLQWLSVGVCAKVSVWEKCVKRNGWKFCAHTAKSWWWCAQLFWL